LIPIDALSSACWEKEEKKKKKRKEEQQGAFFPQGQTCLAGCAASDFHPYYIFFLTLF
jgi:hypothetical protein